MAVSMAQTVPSQPEARSVGVPKVSAEAIGLKPVWLACSKTLKCLVEVL
jgi:hypothetical protein